MLKYLFIFILFMPFIINAQKTNNLFTEVEGYMIVRFQPKPYTFLGMSSSQLEFFADIKDLQRYLELENDYNFYLFFDYNRYPTSEIKSNSMYSFVELNASIKGKEFLRETFQDKYDSVLYRSPNQYNSISIWRHFNQDMGQVVECATKIILVYKVKLPVIKVEKLKKKTGSCDLMTVRERKKEYKCPYYFNGSFRELKFLYKVIY